MIRRHLMALRVALMLGDGVTAALVFLLMSFVRFGKGPFADVWSGLGIDLRLAAIAWGAGWVAVLWYQGLYRLRARWRLRTEAQDIFRAIVVVAALTLAALFLIKQQNVSRLFLFALFAVQPLITLASRGILRLAFSELRRRGHSARYMLVVGTGKLAQDFADLVEARPGLGLHVIGHVSVPGEEQRVVTRPILGNLNGIEDVLHANIVDEVAACLAPESAGLLEPIASLAADEGKTVRIPVRPSDGGVRNAREEEFEGLLVRSLVHDDHRDVGLIVKRLIDVVGAVVGLILLSPVLLVTAILIRLRDGSPVIFRQTRVGLHGRRFTILKFRTMAPDAEERLHEVAHLNELEGAAFKATDDPRMSPLGRKLRRASIDELPQLWNVLRGDMSLVGPRPPLPSEVVEYDIWHRRRLSMKPGITGLWQVESRQEPSFDRWVELDLSYIDRWTLWLDLSILLRTMPNVMMARGR
ncbi:MAG: sugar transferase [Chloroflexota bacterium]|nr:sugar transferase [Chloroflexota bacterium]